MIRKSKNSPFIRVGRSGRKKRILLKELIQILLGSFIAITLTLWGLSNYTGWLLHREYDSKQDALVKKWIPQFKWFSESINLDFLKNNIAAASNVLFSPPSITNSSLPTINLRLKNNGLSSLNIGILQYHFGDLQKKPRIRGLIEETSGSLIPVRINLRGSMRDHHQVWKPSLRIRFPKTHLKDGFQNHIMVAPKDGIGMQNWLSNRLSSYWDMFGTKEHFTRLFINNQYFGVYNRVWRLDESLAINSNRIPGPFFRLEVQNKRQFYIGNYWLWPELRAWEIIGIPLKRGEIIFKRALDASLKNWDKLITSNSGSSNYRSEIINYLLDLNEFLDSNEMAKYLAILCHSGEDHIDFQHNNAMWMDQTTGKLVPILMDVGGYEWRLEHKSLIRPILKTNGAFLNAWLTNPHNQALYLSRLFEMTETFGSLENTEKLIRKQWNIIRTDAIADVNFSKAGNPRKYLAIIQVDVLVENLIEFIRKRINWIKKKITSDTISITRQSNFGFEIFLNGFSGVSIKKKDNGTFRLNSKESLTKSYLLPSMSFVRESELSHLYNIPKSYSFYTLDGHPENYEFMHRLTGKPLAFSTPPLPKKLKVLRAASGVNFLEFPDPKRETVKLGPGKLTWNKTREFHQGQKVIILPGTDLKLGPGVSLLVRGPLHIQGTSEKPVTLRPLDPEKPFGVLALFGKETGGSRIHHLDMEGGSVHRRYNLKFTGMLSIHDCPDIAIFYSRFGKNFIGDDGVHIMRSRARVLNSTFENAFADGMDWDKVQGEISGSLFINSGNDGLDLSMGNVTVNSSRFEASRDKCLSIGEGALARVTDSSFHNCNDGIAVKDRSQVELVDGLFLGCKIAYNSYRKKWRWEKGGEGVLLNTHFLNSTRADLAGDKYSKVYFPMGLPDNLTTQGKIHIDYPKGPE